VKRLVDLRPAQQVVEPADAIPAIPKGLDHSHAGEDGKHRLVIEAYGYRWYRVGGLDYLLRRTEVDEPLHPKMG